MPVTMLFSIQQSVRLSGATIGRLRYWRETNVLRPSVIDDESNGPFKFLYSFVDVVSLRTLVALRDQHHIELNELRLAGNYLRTHSNHPWSSISIRVAGKHIAFLDPVLGQWTSAHPIGQRILEIDLENLRAQTERDARKLLGRKPESTGRVSRNRNVMSNLLVFEGTRIPVEAVVSLHQAGMSREAILAQFPTLSHIDIEVALGDTSPGRISA